MAVGITSLNGLTTAIQTFANDTNIQMVSTTATHTITWAGTLADGRIASASNWNTAYSATNAATNANTASTIVKRDGSGNFSAGTITAALTGTASGNLVSGGALGTPSSGTVTNLTGTASININGTVGATTPATGVFTTASFNSDYTGGRASALGNRAAIQQVQNPTTTAPAGKAMSLWIENALPANVTSSMPGQYDLVSCYQYLSTPNSAAAAAGVNDYSLWGWNTSMYRYAADRGSLYGFEMDFVNLTSWTGNDPSSSHGQGGPGIATYPGNSSGAVPFYGTNRQGHITGFGSVLLGFSSGLYDGSAGYLCTLNYNSGSPGTSTAKWRYGYVASGVRHYSFYAGGRTNNESGKDTNNAGNHDPLAVLYNDTDATTLISSVGTHTDILKVTSGGNVKCHIDGNGSAAFGMAVSAPEFRCRVKAANNNGSTYPFVLDSSTDTGTNHQMFVSDNGYGWINAASGVWNIPSDANLKENISYVSTGLAQIKQLTPATFDMKAGPKNQFGFIAQDVQKVYPRAVTVSPMDGTLTLNTGFLFPMLVNAVRELDRRVTALEQQQHILGPGV